MSVDCTAVYPLERVAGHRFMVMVSSAVASVQTRKLPLALAKFLSLALLKPFTIDCTFFQEDYIHRLGHGPSLASTVALSYRLASVVCL